MYESLISIQTLVDNKKHKVFVEESPLTTRNYMKSGKYIYDYFVKLKPGFLKRSLRESLSIFATPVVCFNKDRSETGIGSFSSYREDMAILERFEEVDNFELIRILEKQRGDKHGENKKTKSKTRS